VASSLDPPCRQPLLVYRISDSKLLDDLLDRALGVVVAGFNAAEDGSRNASDPANLPAGHQDVMGEIYEDRSSVEHLHEDRLLEPFERPKRLALVKKEAVLNARPTAKKPSRSGSYPAPVFTQSSLNSSGCW
jgi:hypothetical protein